jgi:hypothetical protein
MQLATGLAIKNPPKKTRPIKPKKTQKKTPKNPPQSGFFGFYWDFLKLKSVFGAKVTIFL